MAKLVVVCRRGYGSAEQGLESGIRFACSVMAPTHIDAHEPVVGSGAGIYWGVSNPTGKVSHSQSHALVGTPFGGSNGFQVPGGGVPDGSFALARFNEQTLELVSDVVGSRTIWYYVDETTLIASTSQRAIIAVLGTFEFNDDVVPWYLSGGSLGPSASWDRRVKRLPPASVLTLSRTDWAYTIRSEELQFVPERVSAEEHEIRLREAIASAMDALTLRWDRWMLPLSGGGDSRVLLQALAETGAVREGLRSVTWGAAAARSKVGNDAYVAKLLADRFGIPNVYLSNDHPVDPEIAIDRFIRAGDGRVDHVAAYTDGMATWSSLFTRGIAGTLRGDQAFGLPHVEDELDARLRARLILLDDVGNLRQFRHLDWPEQQIPPHLNRREAEPLDQWRDRLSISHRVPTYLAALSDIKLAYSEQVNPFLSRIVIDEVLRTPDEFRTGKSLFRRLAADVSPEIPFATHGANASPGTWMANEALRQLISDGVATAATEGTVPRPFAVALQSNFLKAAVSRPSLRRRLRKSARQMLPSSSIARIRSRGVLPFIDWTTLGLRVHLMSQVRRRLAQDAAGPNG